MHTVPYSLHPIFIKAKLDTMTILQQFSINHRPLEVFLNPIVVGLFDSTILVGGGKKAPPT